MPECKEVQKSQTIRVLDVLLIGPLMVMGGNALRKQHPELGTLLAVFGITTVAYNAANFHATRQANRPSKD